MSRLHRRIGNILQRSRKIEAAIQYKILQNILGILVTHENGQFCFNKNVREISGWGIT